MNRLILGKRSRRRAVCPLGAAVGAIALLGSGCAQWYLDDADREVATLIEQRQRAALGFTSNADIGSESAHLGRHSSAYDFVPSPIDADVPESFKGATRDRPFEAALDDFDPDKNPDEERFEDPSGDPFGDPPTDEDGGAVGDAEDWGAAEMMPEDGAPPEESLQPSGVRTMTLTEVMGYALKHSREYQSQKESLYLAALDLTLERFLWTPRFVESALSVEFDDLGQISNFDRSVSAVSRFAVEQRLPYGGEVTARVVNSLIRNIRDEFTSDETGQFSIDARIPLLQGAGPVAYESRYQTERDLIYAVRGFERFRRTFVVEIAADFFNLLSLKTRISSAQAQEESLAADYARDKALVEAEEILPIEADRSQVSLLNARNNVASAIEQYQTSLDFFKIRLGMPTDEAIDVVDTALNLADPEVAEEEAIDVALRFRLDLLNNRDAMDDARRGVNIAENGLLPRMDFVGAVVMDTDPDQPNSAGYNDERTSWNAGLTVEIPLNRKAERNAYRASFIGLRRVERNYDQAVDTVRLEVRRAMRRLVRTRFTMDIQQRQISINEFRKELARAKYQTGELASNRDVVEAENDLRDAKNALADAESQFRQAVLEFLLDTGTLRVTDEGEWVSYEEAIGEKAP